MYVGIDLGGTNIAAGIVQNEKIIKKGAVKTNSARPYTEIMRDIAHLVRSLVDDIGAGMDQIEAVGVGSPGIADIKNGILSNVVNISNEPMLIREQLHGFLNTEIFVENDARCACLGEYIAGAAKGARNAVMITLGTGIGSGIIIDGKLYAGSAYAAGEAGHTVIQAGGIPCKCGRRGCWEQYASASALIRMANQKMMECPESNMAHESMTKEVDGKFVFELAKQGDTLANEVVSEYVYYVSVGICNMINLFRPDIVVVGGGISAQGEYLLEPVRKLVYEEILCKEKPLPEIRQAEFGNDAGIIGAAMCGKYQNLE